MSVIMEHEYYVYSVTSGVLHLTQGDVQFRDVEKVVIRIVVAFLRQNLSHSLFTQASPQRI